MGAEREDSNKLKVPVDYHKYHPHLSAVSGFWFKEKTLFNDNKKESGEDFRRICRIECITTKPNLFGCPKLVTTDQVWTILRNKKNRGLIVIVKKKMEAREFKAEQDTGTKSVKNTKNVQWKNSMTFHFWWMIFF